MDYHLTEHAGLVLAKRCIELEWLQQVLGDPEWTEQDAIDPDLEHRLGHIAAFGGRVLRVIVNVKVEPPRVVTAYFDRRRRDR